MAQNIVSPRECSSMLENVYSIVILNIRLIYDNEVIIEEQERTRKNGILYIIHGW